MNANYSSDTHALRAEIATLAARMIAEDGADYSSAKRKAAKHILGNQKVKGDVLPDNSEIEQEVREYNALFFGDTQPQRLLLLRQIAADVMQELERFNPYLIGAVLNGTAGKHSDIHLHLFTDNCKDVAIYLLNKNIAFETSETTGARHEPVEILSFLFKQEGVHLSLFDTDDIKSGSKQERANLTALRQLLITQPNE